MSEFEDDYKNLIKEIYVKGVIEETRTGVDAISLFNRSLNINLQKGFPIITGRKIFFDKALHEYIWIREGLTTLTYLHQNNIKWWDSYANKNGDLGKTYGYQLRNFNGEVDQLDYAHRLIREKSRQGHVTFWNPSDIYKVALPPCFTGATFHVQGNKLNMAVQFRSSDVMVGLPYDIIVMALFATDMAKFNDLEPGFLGIQITNAHIYVNHDIQTKKYLESYIHDLPELVKEKSGLYSLLNYNHGKHLYFPLNK